MTAKSTDWRPGPTVCRCCLSDGCYKDISTEYFWMGKREVYAEMLSETLSLTIAYSQSGGPNSNSRLICEACIARLRDASDFRRQVLECEKTFMHHLDPGSSTAALDLEVPLVETLGGGDVKLEVVKLEKQLSDDDDFGDTEFLDDDDDDLDDQPLMNLATKIPKKESVDLMDLLDNAKVTEKRKSSTKTKTSPSKKPKIVKREVKPTPSKAQPKPEKKKKEFVPFVEARQNAKLLLRYCTAYPFRLPSLDMVCVYCCESYEDPALYRHHMRTEHPVFNVKTAFAHTMSCEEYLKVDCTELECRICNKKFDIINSVAEHLVREHNKRLNLQAELGIMVFKLGKERWVCAICSEKHVSLRALSRHNSGHYHKYTCESCGKSYISKENLNKHIIYGHSKEKICVKCRKSFPTIEERREHLLASKKCWPYTCTLCAERFRSRKTKSVHLAEVHSSEIVTKTHKCPECNVIFDEWRLYRTHFIINHTDTHYKCPICGLKFVNNASLEEHKVSHTKEKLFHCTVCSKSFVRKKNLNQHMWIHSEHKRFHCEPCKKQFNQRVSWKTHMRSYHPELVDFI